MMNEAHFWKLIAEAKSAVKQVREIPGWLENRLLEYSLEEIMDFGAWLAHFLDKADDEKLWFAGSILAGGMSDDGFVYFKCWLVAQGEAVYKTALKDPDSLAVLDYPDTEGCRPNVDLELLLYVYGNAFNKKIGQPKHTKVELPPGYKIPPNCHPYRTARKNVGFLREASKWPKDSIELVNSFPKLAKRFLLT